MRTLRPNYVTQTILILLILSLTLATEPSNGERGAWILEVKSPEGGETVHLSLSIRWDLIKGEAKPIIFDVAIANSTTLDWTYIAQDIEENDAIVGINEYMWNDWDLPISSFSEGHYNVRVEVWDTGHDQQYRNDTSGPFYLSHEKPLDPLTATISSPSEGGDFKSSEQIYFKASITGAEGETTISWTNGTNSLGNGESFHAYLEPGQYHITLEVTDGEGRTTTDHVNFTVREHILEPDLIIKDIRYPGFELEVNRTTYLLVDVLNSGSGEAKDVVVNVSFPGQGKTLDSTIDLLPANTTTTLNLSFMPTVVGEMEVRVSVPGASNYTETITVTEGKDTVNGDNGKKNTKEPGTLDKMKDYLREPLVLLLILAIVIIAVVAVIFRGKRGKPEEIEAEEDIDWSSLMMEGGEGDENPSSEPFTIPEIEAHKEKRTDKKPKGKTRGRGRKGNKSDKKRKGTRKPEEEIDDELQDIMNEVFK